MVYSPPDLTGNIHEYPIYNRGIMWSPFVSTKKNSAPRRHNAGGHFAEGFHGQARCTFSFRRQSLGPVFGIPIWENSGIFAEKMVIQAGSTQFERVSLAKSLIFFSEKHNTIGIYGPKPTNMADVVGRCVSAPSSQCVSQLVVEPRRERYCQLG